MISLLDLPPTLLDAAGLPVTISASGSYRLTGALQNGDIDSRAIEVTTDDVTIDLSFYEWVWEFDKKFENVRY